MKKSIRDMQSRKGQGKAGYELIYVSPQEVLTHALWQKPRITRAGQRQSA
jgi:hypothetical protein